MIIEKKVFMRAYAMRRLLQSDKLSSSIGSHNIKIHWFPSIRKIQKEDRWDIHQHYDVTASSPTSLTIPRILDLTIHSFIFREWYDHEEADTKIVFTSDIKRDAYLWLIGLPAFVEVMRFVANDVPHVLTRRFDPGTGSWVEQRGNDSVS